MVEAGKKIDSIISQPESIGWDQPALIQEFGERSSEHVGCASVGQTTGMRKRTQSSKKAEQMFNNSPIRANPVVCEKPVETVEAALDRFPLKYTRLTRIIPADDRDFLLRNCDVVRNIARPDPLRRIGAPPELIFGFRHGKRAVHAIKQQCVFTLRLHRFVFKQGRGRQADGTCQRL